MNRGFRRGLGPGALIPEWMGGGDPTKDGQLLTADTSQEGAAKWAPSSGGGSAALTLIASQILGASTANVTFASIPSTYNGLRLVIQAASVAAVALDSVRLKFNGDTGSNYARVLIQVAATTVTGALSNAASNMTIGNVPGASAGQANNAGVLVVEVPHYAGSSLVKQALVTSSVVDSTTANDYAALVGGQWTSTAAINRIDLSEFNGPFATGSSFYLYGVT